MSYLNLPDILKILISHTDMHMVTFLNYLQIAKLILITNYFTLHVLYCMLVLKHFFSYIKLPNYSPGEWFEKLFLFFWVLLSFKPYGFGRRKQVSKWEPVSGSYLPVHFRAMLRPNPQSAWPVQTSSTQDCSWEGITCGLLWEWARKSCRLPNHRAGKQKSLVSGMVGSLCGEREKTAFGVKDKASFFFLFYKKQAEASFRKGKREISVCFETDYLKRVLVQNSQYKQMFLMQMIKHNTNSMPDQQLISRVR